MEPAVSPDPGVNWHAHEQEARLLVELLRTSRVVLLFGQPGSDKTGFLHRALVPRLHRRSTDRVLPTAPPATSAQRSP